MVYSDNAKNCVAMLDAATGFEVSCSRLEVQCPKSPLAGWLVGASCSGACLLLGHAQTHDFPCPTG